MKMYVENWDKYENFNEREFSCSHTGKVRMLEDFVDVLQAIRNAYSKPIVISSAYRHPTHPIEIEKNRPGEHSFGAAVDVLCSGKDALEILFYAQNFGIKRIGVNQKGNHASRFIHLGWGDKELTYPEAIWSY